jgi:hypothetical protein
MKQEIDGLVAGFEGGWTFRGKMWTSGRISRARKPQCLSRDLLAAARPEMWRRRKAVGSAIKEQPFEDIIPDPSP